MLIDLSHIGGILSEWFDRLGRLSAQWRANDDNMTSTKLRVRPSPLRVCMVRADRHLFLPAFDRLWPHLFEICTFADRLLSAAGAV